MEELRPCNAPYDYEKDKEALERFLLTFESNGRLKYMAQIKALPQKYVIEIDIEDIMIEGNVELHFQVIKNTLRYVEMVYEIIDGMIKREEIEMPKSDLYFEHRKIRAAERHGHKSVFDLLPPAMTRFYTVHIYRKDLMSFSEIAPENIGALIGVKGVVSKVSEVHPSIWVAVYVCDQCTSEVFQEVSGESFLPITECTTERCKAARVKGTLHLQTRPSKFRPKQVMQIQEMPRDVQPGRVPRTITVDLYDDLVRQAAPGSEVLMSGILLPRPNEGMQRLYMGLLSDSYVLCSRIVLAKKKNNSASIKTTRKETKPSLSLLIDSVAPEIAGLTDIKKILLLVLIGGDPYTEDGMQIRGEINVLLVGDPGVAKSQLLKAICRISPRGIFTTGRGASSAGLTACVTRDPDTGEHRLEGGALVMSDGGVCCIDEFDKMKETDRSCVHEAMEQQRISISKAGISTSLNARCSVVAAANPIRGRYIEKKSIAWNAGLPSALISRFDVVRVMLDKAGKEDVMIADHVLDVHKKGGAIKGVLSPQELADEIAIRKEICTTLAEGVKERIVEAYACEREKAQRTGEVQGSARRVLSVLRVAQALAKADLRSVVEIEDIEEALRLVGNNNPVSVYDAILSVGGENKDGYQILSMENIYKDVKQFGRDDINACIRENVEKGIWSLNEDLLTIYKV